MLDEPTNHLDLESITALIIKTIKVPWIHHTRSHEFAQTVGNRVVELTPNGAIDRYMTSMNTCRITKVSCEELKCTTYDIY
jgi:ATPase subunit of ABC transporter with duplicated ATPase domains